ncbi:hypothetical protein CH063_11253, partial [Colletotrichum higginsianum]
APNQISTSTCNGTARSESISPRLQTPFRRTSYSNADRETIEHTNIQAKPASFTQSFFTRINTPRSEQSICASAIDHL